MVLQPLAFEQDRDAKRSEKRGLDGLEQGLGRPNIGAADENGVVFQIFQAAREQGPMDEVTHAIGRHSAVSEKLRNARINGHHAIKDAWLRVGIELDQDRVHKL